MNRWTKLLFVIFIIIAGFFALRDSFKLTLFGDDWLVFWRYNYHLGPTSIHEFNYLTYFLTVYGPEDMSLGVFQSIFHYNSIYYYSLSFILRTLAAISIFPFVYFLTKNKLSALIASLFFAVTFIAIETTNWVFNMPSYLAIITFNAFLYVFISKKNLNIKSGFILGLLCYLTLIIQPIRMTGLPLIVLALELFWILENKSLSSLKKSVLRLSIIIVAFLLVKFGGQSFGYSNEIVQRILAGLSIIIQQLNSGHYDILMNPLIMIGSLFIPDILWSQVITFKAGTSLFLSIAIPFLFIYLLICFVFYKIIPLKNNPKRFLLINSIFAILLTLCIRFIYKQNVLTFSDPFKIGEALIGGYFLILSFSLIFTYFKTPKALTIFLSVCITVLSFIIPWLFVPNSYYITSHRYFILAALGIGIFWGSIIALSNSKLFRTIIFLLFIGAITLQIQANNIFFSRLITARGNGISDKIWAQLSKSMPNIKTSQVPLVFYFQGDGYNSDTINDVITFGFPPHVALLYNIYHDDNRIPIPLTDYKELQAIVTTGKPLNAYGRVQQPLPIDHIYAFKIEGRTKVIDITNETRKNLKTEIK